MESIIRDQVVFYSYYASLMSGRWTWIQEDRLTVYIWIWIWIKNRQNLHWSITSISVHRCLWHGAQLHLECRDIVCIHCQLGQRVPLWDGSYKEGVLVLLSIGWYVTELVVMLAAGSCICSCKDVIHRYCYFTMHYSEEECQPDLASPFLEGLPL